ncbi:G-protein coupled receptor [Tyrophagus putrescentiae]|nr:G-protein coupled receptor [Tyrophagus putrescentiae]
MNNSSLANMLEGFNPPPDPVFSNSSTANHSAMCDAIFDGIYNWPATRADTIISVECHKIFSISMGHDVDQDYQNERQYASRKCLPNGVWGWSNWTNYTECLNLLSIQEKDSSTVNRVQSIISYIVLIFLIASLVSLILSIVIFMSFKPLQCLRIRVHKNLCIALLMNCCLYIIMNSLVGIHKMDLSVAANWFCKTLKCLNVYSSMATINWMFVEGFLFHRRLYAPFHQNTKWYLVGYYVIGWVFPALCVLAWSLSLEFASVVAHKPCWEGYRTSNTIFIVSTPMIIAVAINFIFLISIIRILITKLRADTSHSDQATIKAIKATALLIPLLGIHHMVVLYNPSTFNRKLVNVYIVLNVLFQSVQGIIVSVLYCFTNNEVRTVLNAAWSRRRMSHSFHGQAVGNNSLLAKRRRPSINSNSFNSLITQHQANKINNNNNNNNVDSNGNALNNNSNTITSNNNITINSNLPNSPHNPHNTIDSGASVLVHLNNNHLPPNLTLGGEESFSYDSSSKKKQQKSAPSAPAEATADKLPNKSKKKAAKKKKKKDQSSIGAAEHLTSTATTTTTMMVQSSGYRHANLFPASTAIPPTASITDL